MDYHITDNEFCQDGDLNKELQTKFTPKRKSAELLAQSYYRLGYEDKAERVGDCGTALEFRRYEDEDSWKLNTANFCRDRLCPMCSWRRSYKVFAQVSQMMNVISGDYVFLFLTLTVPNCSADELADTLDKMMYAFTYKLRKHKRWRKAVKGYFRALEVTRHNKRDKLYGTYHPHFHIILAVDKSYFTGTDYIPRDEWLQMWQQATGDFSITQVDIRRCKPKEEIQEGEKAVKSLSAAVAEVSKYSVKSSDYIISGDTETTDEVVFTLGAALHGRRLCSFGGCFDEARKKLNLDDCENGDLVHVDGTEIRADVALMIRRYGWTAGAYKLIEERRAVNVSIECDEED